MNKTFLCLIFIIISLALRAEPVANSDSSKTKIDSLENLLYNSLSLNLSPKEKINICNGLIELYNNKSWDKQIEYAARSLVLSNEIEDDVNIAHSLTVLTSAYQKLDNYEKAIEYANRLYQIQRVKNNELETAQALFLIGSCYYDWSKYVEAKDHFEKALEIFKKKQDFNGIANSLRNIAKILSDWGEYDQALNINQEALKFWEEIGDEVGLANSYNSMGVIYQELENYDRASDYFQKSLDIFKKLNRTADIVNLILHIGDVYLNRKQYDKALEYYFNADLIGKDLNNKKLKSITLSNIGEAYNLKGDYLKALDYQKKALKLKEEIGDKKRLTITYTELGVIYKNVEDYDQSLYYLDKGMKLAQEMNLKYLVIKCYLNLSEVYTGLGNYKKTFEYYKQYIEGKENLYSEESKQTIAELLAKYQLEKKDKDNERLRHSEQLNKAQIRNQQVIIGFVLFMLLGVFAITIILNSRYHQNQKHNIDLSLKNKEIENQQKYVEILNKDLKEANATKDKFFSIVAHDLKSPFNSLLVLTNLLIDDFDTLSREDQKKFIEQIKESSENTFALLQNLLDWASTQMGKTKIVSERVDIAKISDEIIALLQPIARSKKISLKSEIPLDTLVYADKNMVSTVLLNLVTNAIKFTPQFGNVSIRSTIDNKQLEIEVADTGVGISHENLDKLFRLDQKVQTVGTAKEKGTGLGLIICKEFIEKNNGKLWTKSIVGKGSQFYFTLPV